MTDQARLEADARAMLGSAADVDAAAASLNLARLLMARDPDGPDRAAYSRFGHHLADEYASFAVDLGRVLHEAPALVFSIADRLRATAAEYVSTDVVTGASFRRLEGGL
ncbi:MAG TPA: hypothetical protein VLJ59_05515 [Mycobacteriales bacterium]|nr:hypothetical protein [Mycobacteriales bacterium]